VSKKHYQDSITSTFKKNGISKRNKFHHNKEGRRDIYAGSHSFTFFSISLKSSTRHGYNLHQIEFMVLCDDAKDSFLKMETHNS
jgi:hypothetical protein